MSERTLIDYWMVLYKRKKAIFIVVAASVFTTLLLGFLLDPVYEAKATFYVPSVSPATSYMAPSSERLRRDLLAPTPKEEDNASFIGLLKSMKIAEYVHEDFPTKSIAKLRLSDVSYDISNEYMTSIYSRDKDPVIAANVANAYLKYLNMLLQSASSNNIEKDRSMVRSQVDLAEQNFKEAKAELKKYEEKNNIASLDDDITNLTLQKATFEGQVETAVVQIHEIDEKINSLEEQLKKEGGLISQSDYVLSNPMVDYLQKKLSDINAQISSASVEKTENHPEIKMLKNEQKTISDRLNKEIQDLISSQIKPAGTFFEQLRQNLVNYLIDKNRLLASLKGNKEVVDRIISRLRLLPAVKEEWSSLNDKSERFKKIYEQLQIDLQESEMQQARPVQYLVVVDYAKPPGKPAFPVWWLNIFVSLIFGIGAGVFWAFFIDYLEAGKKERKLKIIKAILSEERD